LGLDEIGRIDARFWSYHYLIHVVVGVLSTAVVLSEGSPALAGFLYVLLGPLCQWNGVIARRRTRDVESKPGGGASVTPLAQRCPRALPARIGGVELDGVGSEDRGRRG
jgi:hypothetical protein